LEQDSVSQIGWPFDSVSFGVCLAQREQFS
jgi:hypothetical protein